MFVDTFGENLETSEMWPEVENYFNVAFWILSYTPGVTNPLANCESPLRLSSLFDITPKLYNIVH